MRALLILGLGTMATTSGVGCGSSPESVDADTQTTYDCAADPRGETYTPGMDKVGTAMAFDFKLMDATPAPPLRGNNSWTIEIDSMSAGVAGAPAAGLESTMTVTPYMPDHMHGSPIAVGITPVTGTPGQYTLDPINLWMPGYWATTIEVTSGQTVDKAVFGFCLSS